MLVTLSVIYLEFKAHLTSMATTAFSRETPSHLVFNRTMSQNTPRLCKGSLTKKESDGVYLVNNKSLSQYFVIYPLLAIAEVKRFL